MFSHLASRSNKVLYNTLEALKNMEKSFDFSETLGIRFFFAKKIKKTYQNIMKTSRNMLCRIQWVSRDLGVSGDPKRGSPETQEACAREVKVTARKLKKKNQDEFFFQNPFRIFLIRSSSIQRSIKNKK